MKLGNIRCRKVKFWEILFGKSLKTKEPCGLNFQYSRPWKPISLSSSQLLTSDPGSLYPSSLLLQDWTLSYSGSLPQWGCHWSSSCQTSALFFFIICKMFLSDCKAMPSSIQFSFRSWSRHGCCCSTQPPSLPQEPTRQQRLAIPVKQMNEAMFGWSKSYLEIPQNCHQQSPI